MADTATSILKRASLRTTRSRPRVRRGASVRRWTLLTSAALAVLGSPSAALAAPADYQFVTKWGGYGAGEGKFRSPSDVAVDGQGNVYVTDFGYGLDFRHFYPRVKKFDSNGKFLRQWGSYGTRRDQFRSPNAVATDSRGNVYVADTGQRVVNGSATWPCVCRIQKFNSNGRLLDTWGRAAAREPHFSPWSLAVDGDDNVYVLDRRSSNWRPGHRKLRRADLNKYVEKFSPSGRLLAKWGRRGDGPGELWNPWRLAVDAQGNVYVTDHGRSRGPTEDPHVTKFDSGGHFLTEWGGELQRDDATGHLIGRGEGRFSDPWGVAVDGRGNVLVTDVSDGPDPTRVQKFDSNGAFLTALGRRGKGDGEFRQPRAVAVDAQGGVYVVDVGGSRRRPFNRVQKFAPAAPAGVSTSSSAERALGAASSGATWPSPGLPGRLAPWVS